MENEKKFHEKTWFMWVMMFLITPVGIVLMWKNNKYKPVVRVLISVVFGLMLISAIVGDGTSNSDSTNSNEVVQAVEEVPELTPEEQAKVDFDLWVKTQFSFWDGSNTPLVELVKKNMNDPKSFE